MDKEINLLISMSENRLKTAFRNLNYFLDTPPFARSASDLYNIQEYRDFIHGELKEKRELEKYKKLITIQMN